MHEISIVRQVTKTVMDYAEENHVTEISEIILQIGELSMIVPEYVDEIYPLVVKGTMLEHTKLKMEMIPGMAECNECDEVFNVVEHEGYCPNCGSFDKTVLSGRDFVIKEILVPDDGTEN
ncbi:MAG: hydrogenase maturation nickel metallochaperone HypA [Oscillospiraceae bacterium]|nr:hydrogenase maturation nickel metallochaperone HypA [Oscillospiraceae bacterium]